MSYKIKYKDGTEENLDGYDEVILEENYFVIFEGKGKDDLHIAKDIIAKIE